MNDDFLDWFTPAVAGGGGTPPSYVANGSLATASGETLTIAPYTGVADGHIIYLLVVSEFAQSDESPTSPQWPSGFTQIASAESNSMTCAYLAWKRASSESGNYAVTVPDHASAVSGLSFGISGAAATGDPNNQSSGLYGTGATGAFTAITPTVDNCLILEIATSAENYSSAPLASGWTGGGLTWTERFDLAGGDSNSLAMATAPQTTAAAVSSPSMTFSASPAGGYVNLLVAVKP